MNKYLMIVGLAGLVLAGCATYTGTGSEAWYNQRIAEVEASYKEKRISEQEYLTLKNQIDQIRVDYVNRGRSSGPSFGFGYGVVHGM